MRAKAKFGGTQMVRLTRTQEKDVIGLVETCCEIVLHGDTSYSLRLYLHTLACHSIGTRFNSLQPVFPNNTLSFSYHLKCGHLW